MATIVAVLLLGAHERCSIEKPTRATRFIAAPLLVAILLCAVRPSSSWSRSRIRGCVRLMDRRTDSSSVRFVGACGASNCKTKALYSGDEVGPVSESLQSLERVGTANAAWTSL